MSLVGVNIRNLFENIKNDIQVEYNLSELKIALGSLNATQLSTIITSEQLNFIFDCLNSSNLSQVLTTCDILILVLGTRPPQIILSDFATPLIRALGHPAKEVKEMALKELTRGVGENELLTLLNPSVLNLLITCLCDTEISVGSRAVEFFTRLGQTPQGLNIICDHAIVHEFVKQSNLSDINKIRMYQVLVDISVNSAEGLEKIETSGLFSGLIQQLKSKDVLATMASLEVITPLGETVHGYDFLLRNDIIDLLAQQITSSAEDNPLVSLEYPGLAKFFGHIGRAFPERLVSLFPNVLSQLFSGIDSNDISISIASLETIAFISYSTAGKAALHKQDEQLMRHVMDRLKELLTILPTEWRARALYALADILHFSVGCVENDATKLTMVWFNQLGPSALQTVVAMTRQPFPDIKTAAFKVVENIAAHRWGQVQIANQPGLLEYLLDRSTETTLEGKQAKYDIINTLYNSPTISSTFEDEKCDRMSNFIKEGAFYVPTGNRVAVEGD